MADRSDAGVEALQPALQHGVDHTPPVVAPIDDGVGHERESVRFVEKLPSSEGDLGGWMRSGTGQSGPV